jgi:hypothetical protein
MNTELERIGKRVLANFKVGLPSGNLTGRTEENHESSQHNLCPGQELNQGPLEYEAGMLITRPRGSVEIKNKNN